MQRPLARAAGLLLPLLGLTLPAAAQLDVDLVGKIEKAENRCSRSITHKLACSDVYLFGNSGVDLSKLEGQQVNVKGSLQLALCVLVQVTEATEYRNVMEISPSTGGSFRIGESAVFRMRSPFLSLVPLLISGNKFFFPLAQFGHAGIGLPLIWANTKIALLGTATTSCPIPNERGLVGVDIYSQGAFLTITVNGIEGRLTNVDCFTIQGLEAR